MVSDNGLQLVGWEGEWFLEGLLVEHRFASIGHAKTYMQVQAANKFILDGIKRESDTLGGKWTDEWENILWAIKTTPKKSTGESSFSSVYEYEVVVPVEIAVVSHWLRYFSENAWRAVPQIRFVRWEALGNERNATKNAYCHTPVLQSPSPCSPTLCGGYGMKRRWIRTSGQNQQVIIKMRMTI